MVAAILGTTLPLCRFHTMDREEIKANLRNHLHYLSVTLGDRSIYRPGNLQAAADYVFQNFAAMGYALGCDKIE